jgi:hypothetical protein
VTATVPLLIASNARIAELSRLRSASERCHGIGDRVVEAPIERAKLFDAHRGALFRGQLGDGLAEVPVVTDDLIDGKSLSKQLAAMSPGGCSDRCG